LSKFDVSNHQGAIAWDRVAEDRISFAYIKASEGASFVDAGFPANWTGARRAGIAVGAYHFFTLCASGDGQAQNFLRAAPPEPAGLSPAVDLELAGNCAARPDRSTALNGLGVFIHEVKAAWGKPVVLYLVGTFEDRYHVEVTVGRPLRQPRLLRHPSSGSWLIWQVDGYANVHGVHGWVDLDVMRPARSA